MACSSETTVMPDNGNCGGWFMAFSKSYFLIQARQFRSHGWNQGQARSASGAGQYAVIGGLRQGDNRGYVLSFARLLAAIHRS
jgi:hypothetical protein